MNRQDAQKRQPFFINFTKPYISENIVSARLDNHKILWYTHRADREHDPFALCFSAEGSILYTAEANRTSGRLAGR